MDFVGLILQLFPGRAGCESSAQGEGVGWHAQVAHRYMFSFCAYQHFTHQLLFCSKAEPPWHAWDWEGKEERQGSSSRGALCQTLASTSFEAHLCGSDFCPCCSPALSHSPWDLLSLLGPALSFGNPPLQSASLDYRSTFQSMTINCKSCLGSQELLGEEVKPSAPPRP